MMDLADIRISFHDVGGVGKVSLYRISGLEITDITYAEYLAMFSKDGGEPWLSTSGSG